MKKYTIAVTGVGGGVGQSIIKSLYGTDYNVIALDGESLATGLYAVPKAYKIPYSNHPNYINALLEICEKEKCDLLFPGLDAELKILSQNRERFMAIGTTVIVSDEEVVDVSDDKMLFFEKLKAIGVGVPLTYEFTELVKNKTLLSVPIIVKQKVGGARSKNVFLVKNENDLEALIQRKDIVKEEFIASEYIEGDEYTCGTVNLENECKGVIVMRRILRDGDTYKCFVEKNEAIENTVLKIMKGLKPFGACNVQLRLKDGEPYVFEINARCSGTTASRSLCGFNEPKMIADLLLKNIQPEYTIQQKTILRYWKELEVENDSVETMVTNQSLENTNYKKI